MKFFRVLMILENHKKVLFLAKKNDQESRLFRFFTKKGKNVDLQLYFLNLFCLFLVYVEY